MWSRFLSVPINSIDVRKRPWWQWILTQWSRNQSPFHPQWAASEVRLASLLPNHPFLPDPKGKLLYSVLSSHSHPVAMGMHGHLHWDCPVCVSATSYTVEGSLILNMSLGIQLRHMNHKNFRETVFKLWPTQNLYFGERDGSLRILAYCWSPKSTHLHRSAKPTPKLGWLCEWGAI